MATDNNAAVTHAASLLEWLALYADDRKVQQQPLLLADNTRLDAHAQRIAHALQTLLQCAFPLQFADASVQQHSDSAWDVVLGVLEQFYETPLGVDASQLPRIGHPAIEQNDGDDTATTVALAQLLALALGAAVQCDAKAGFVRDILTMRDAVQADLKAVIESVMATHSGASEQDDASRDSASGQPRDETDLPSLDAASRPVSSSESELCDALPPDKVASSSPSAPLHLSRNAELERVRRENEFLREENSRVACALEDATTKAQHLETDNRTLAETVQQLQLQLEVDVLRKERAVRAMYDERVHALERDLEAATAQLHAHAGVASEAKALRDEVDVLRPMADRVTKAETAVTKYKRKLEDLAGVRETLRRVEEANTELTATTLSLESQLAKTAALQRKLSDAKATNTAVEFRVSELEALLSRQDSELQRVRTKFEASQSALSEATALNTQLQATLDAQLQPSALTTTTGSDTLAGGVSEFNPELMQRLARLEHENASLRAQVSGETSTRIDELRDAVDDAMRLKKSFESRYFATEQELAAAVQQGHELRDALQGACCHVDELEDAARALEQRVSDGAARETAMTSQIESLRTDASNQRCSIESLRVEVNVLLEQCAALNEDVRSHELERDATHRLLERLETQCSEQAQAISTGDTKIMVLRESLQEAAARSEQLAKMLAASDQRVHKLEAANESQSCELVALSTLFGATFEAKERLEAALQQSAQTTHGLQRDLETRLSDAQREREHLIEQHSRHAAALEAAHSNSLARMTDAISAKSAQLQQLTDSTRALECDHAAAIAALRAQHTAEQSALRDTMDAYRQQHSVSDAERDAALSALQASVSAHEAKLKATIASQLEANSQLIERNRALKSELKRRAAAAAQLELAATRLESKVLLLERERAHVASQDERKRESERDGASAAAQLSTQVALVVAEFEQLQREHSALQTRMRACQCIGSGNGTGSSHPPAGVTASGKSYHVDRIRHLEQLKQQEEHKRRELLLVNAKLVQEQRRLQSRTGALTTELTELREKMNSVLLRDERRRKESDAMRRKLEALEASVTPPTAASALLTVQGTEVSPSVVIAAPVVESATEQQRSERRGASSQSLSLSAVSTVGAVRSAPRDAVNDVKTRASESCNEDRSPNVRASRKRKLDGNDNGVSVAKTRDRSDTTEVVETLRRRDAHLVEAVESAASSGGTRVSVKRRMPLFLSNHLQSDARSASGEKPSECQQQ